MANLKGTGAPARTMRAAIGDIYTDETTGNRYKCVFAYRDDESKNYDCQWSGLKNDKKVEIKMEPVKEEAKAEEPVKTVGTEVKEEPQEAKEQEPEQPAKPSNTSSRKNYTNYSKPSNK